MPNQFTRPWLDGELKFLQENIGRLTYKQMEMVINRSPSSIQSKIRYLPFQQRVQKHPVNSNFFKTWSKDMAYVLGFIAADGNICKTGRAHALHIACDDKDVIEKIKLVMGYSGPIREKGRPNGKISYNLRFSDPVLFYDLNKLGITVRKSLTLIPPKIPARLVWHFVRGFFDGDGGVYVKKSCYPSKLNAYFYTASYSMAVFLHQFLTNYLCNFYRGKLIFKLAHKKTPYYEISIGHKAATELFKLMYEDTNLYMERKYQKFLEGISYGGN